MNTKDTKLGQFIFPDGIGIPDKAWLKILSRPMFLATLASFAPEALDALKAEIRNCIGTLFQITLIDILIEGWKKYDDVNRAIEASKQKPKDTFLRTVINHTVESVHHPYIQLYKDDMPTGRLPFEITVSLKIEGLTLKIQNGAITELMTGTCQGNIQLAFDTEVLIDASTEKIDLPGSIAVKPGDVTQVTRRKATSDNDQTQVAHREP
jgi:hypothetical protein